MKAVVIDTETTDTTDEAEVIEYATTEPILHLSELEPGAAIKIHARKYSSRRPISLGAMAVHHIIDADLAGRPPFERFDFPPDVNYIVGHNCDFDWRLIGRPQIRRICTLALARSIWPHLDSHALGAMVYFLHEDKAEARKIVKGAHSAQSDVAMLLTILLPAILRKVNGVRDWTDLWVKSEDARIPTVMPFGKHKGVPLGDVPADYKRWLLNQPDIDPYVALALRK